VQITEAAKAYLGNLLNVDCDSPGRCARLRFIDDGYNVTLDGLRLSTDIVFTYLNKPILFVSPATAHSLANITIDLQDNKRLIFRQSKPENRGAGGQGSDQTNWQHKEHQRLLREVSEISREIVRLRAMGKSPDVGKNLRKLELTSKEKWTEIRALWAGNIH
jgi:hypothetical protein